MNDHRIPPKPHYFDHVPAGTCRWCNVEVGLTKKGKVSKSRWHPVCLQEYKMLFWPSTTRRAVWRRDKGTCRGCGIVSPRKGKPGWCMDHIKPLIEANGDLNFWKMGNLQTLCGACHEIKTSREATERANTRKLLKETNMAN